MLGRRFLVALFQAKQSIRQGRLVSQFGELILGHGSKGCQAPLQRTANLVEAVRGPELLVPGAKGMTTFV